MNIHSKPTRPEITTGPLPASRKIFVTPEAAPDLRVPLREIMLSEGAGEPNLSRSTTPPAPTPTTTSPST